MKSVKLALVGAAVVVCFGLAKAVGQTVSSWQSHSISNIDLLSEPLYLDQLWVGGMLRLRLIASGAPNSSWSVSFTYNNGSSIQVTDKSLGGFIVSVERSEFIIALPIPFAGDIRADSPQANVRVLPISAIFPSVVRSQQVIGENWRIDLFDQDVGTAERSRGMAIARLDLLSAQGTFLGTCSGFRISQGYWMTAAHCVIDDPGEPRAASVAVVQIQPDDYSGRVPISAPFAATPIATGQAAGELNTKRPLMVGDLDYAILQAPNDPGGPAFSLDNISLPRDKLLLELLQHWTGSQGPAAGKARSADAECKVYPHIGNNDPSIQELCPGQIEHGCSSEPGASGGPLVDRMQPFKLVGLHYGQGSPRRWNCALSATSIRNDLCHRHLALAKGLVGCTG